MLLLSLSLSLPQEGGSFPSEETQEPIIDNYDASQFISADEQPDESWTESNVQRQTSSANTTDTTVTLTEEEWYYILENDPDFVHHSEEYKQEMIKKKIEECKNKNCDLGGDCCIQ